MIDRTAFWARPRSLSWMMDRIFEDAFTAPTAARPFDTNIGTMDVYEDGDHLVVKMTLPGVKPEQIDVSVQQQILTVRGEQTTDDEQAGRRSYHVREHRTGSFARSVRLPAWVDADAAQATFEHGVLLLTFPKSAKAKPHRIPIGAGEQASISTAPSAELDAAQAVPSTAETASAPEQQNGTMTNGTQASDKAAGRKAASGKATGHKAAEGKQDAPARAGS